MKLVGLYRVAQHTTGRPLDSIRLYDHVALHALWTHRNTGPFGCMGLTRHRSRIFDVVLFRLSIFFGFNRPKLTDFLGKKRRTDPTSFQFKIVCVLVQNVPHSPPHSQLVSTCSSFRTTPTPSRWTSSLTMTPSMWLKVPSRVIFFFRAVVMASVKWAMKLTDEALTKAINSSYVYVLKRNGSSTSIKHVSEIDNVPKTKQYNKNSSPRTEDEVFKKSSAPSKKW